MSVKQSVGAATLLQSSQCRRVCPTQDTYLIHMLAKHATPINANSTVLGLVPANARTRVTSRRSIAVLLSAEAIVNPPIRSIIVGENIWEKIYLGEVNMTTAYEGMAAYFVASDVESLVCASSDDRMTRRRTKRRGTNIEVTKRGIACSARSAYFLKNSKEIIYLSCPKDRTKHEYGQTPARFFAINSLYVQKCDACCNRDEKRNHALGHLHPS
jgi:hypothetical protein